MADDPRYQPSGLLPTDIFDKTLSDLAGLPNGANTNDTIVREVDDYGNSTTFIIRTIRWDKGNTVFIEQTSARRSDRFILPPKVTAVIARQAEAVSAMIKRRHGKRLAEERKAAGEDLGAALRDPKVRAKALASRKKKAAERRKRKEARG
jgi:hypothetical protein